MPGKLLVTELNDRVKIIHGDPDADRDDIIASLSERGVLNSVTIYRCSATNYEAGVIGRYGCYNSMIIDPILKRYIDGELSLSSFLNMIDSTL